MLKSVPFKTSRGLKAPNLFRGEVSRRDQLRLTLFAPPSAVKEHSPLSTPQASLWKFSLWVLDQGRSPLWYCSITLFHSLYERKPGHWLKSTVRSRESTFSLFEEVNCSPLQVSAPRNPTCLRISPVFFLFSPKVRSIAWERRFLTVELASWVHREWK